MGEAGENVNLYWKKFEFANERISINPWSLIVHGLFVFKRQCFSVRFIQLLWGRGGDIYKLK